MQRTHADVIYGVQRVRKGNLVRRLGGAFFWFFFNLISEVPVSPNVITSRLMTRRYVDALLGFHERELFLAGIFSLAGFVQIPMIVEKEARTNSSYTILKRLSLLVNAITSFSSKPLIFVFYIGVAICLCSGTAAIVLVTKALLLGNYVLGYPTIVVSIWLLGGIIILCLGILGIYQAKIFQEVKDRPLSIVRELYERSANDSHTSS
jgi:putative glycosyltransferase